LGLKRAAVDAFKSPPTWENTAASQKNRTAGKSSRTREIKDFLKILAKLYGLGYKAGSLYMDSVNKPHNQFV